MSSEDESHTVQASLPLLSEPGFVPETPQPEFQFVVEENDKEDSTYNERQSRRKSRKQSETKKLKIFCSELNYAC